MRVQIRYGRGFAEVNIPDQNLVSVLHAKAVPPLPDPHAAVREAIERPLGTPPLRELARGKRNATVVVSDVTRPVPNADILPPLLATLEEAGLARENITILVATGLHRPNEGEELEQVLGPGIADKYPVRNHFARRPEEHAYLGETPRGIPIWVDRGYVEADLKIATGLVEPHCMAGFSGGRKAICTGLCAVESIRHLHGAELLDHELATNLILRGNPVHEELLFIARKAGVDFIVNVTMDEARRTTGVWAGDLEQAHLAACEFALDALSAPVPEMVDIVVTCNAGYPLDTTFYQAPKGILGAARCLKKGGTIILAAEHSEGLGGPEYTQLMTSHDTIESLRRALYDPNHFMIDQWGAHMLLKALVHYELLMLSAGLTDDQIRQVFATPIHSLDEGLEMALARHGRQARVVAIPDGPYVMPYVGEKPTRL